MGICKEGSLVKNALIAGLRGWNMISLRRIRLAVMLAVLSAPFVSVLSSTSANAGSATAVVSTSPNPSRSGDTVGIKAIVTPDDAATPLPSGTIEFSTPDYGTFAATNLVPNGAFDVSTGASHTCAVVPSSSYEMQAGTGAVWCWGSNGFGQLGDGTGTGPLPGAAHPEPVLPIGLTSGVQSVVAGEFHTCALSSGSVHCWGSNGGGAVGIGSTQEAILVPQYVDTLGGVEQISAGRDHTCAIQAGQLFCWGTNSKGQIGDGSVNNRTTPVVVSGMDSGVVKVSAGGRRTCAVRDTGELYCWGFGSDGLLGDGGSVDRTTPVQVADSGVADVGVGINISCLLTTAGGVKCWGDLFNPGVAGIGDGTSARRTTPTNVTGLTSGIAAIAVGFRHACALKTDGTVWCWGSNDNRQIGDGTTTGRMSPVQVSGLTDVVGLASGGHALHTCARAVSGALRCWGYNGTATLGDGTTANRATPVLAQDLDGTAIAAVDYPFSWSYDPAEPATTQKSFELTASFSPDGSNTTDVAPSAPHVHSVFHEETGVALTGPATIRVGQPTAVQATVTVPSGPTPEGSVAVYRIESGPEGETEFYLNSANVAAEEDGSASVDVEIVLNPAAEDVVLEARFAPAVHGYLPSTSNRSYTPTAFDEQTTTTLTAPATAIQNEEFNVEVAVSSAVGAPDGYVYIYEIVTDESSDPPTEQQIHLNSGHLEPDAGGAKVSRATVPLNLGATGARKLMAVYVPGVGYAASQSTAQTVTVGLQPTVTSVTMPSRLQDSVPTSVAVEVALGPSVPSGVAAADGTVYLYIRVTDPGSGETSDLHVASAVLEAPAEDETDPQRLRRATATIDFTPWQYTGEASENQVFLVQYGGSTGYAPSDSATETVEIFKVQPAIAVTSSVATARAGRPFTVTATVTAPDSAVPPTGRVYVMQNGGTLGWADLDENGVASASLTLLGGPPNGDRTVALDIDFVQTTGRGVTDRTVPFEQAVAVGRPAVTLASSKPTAKVGEVVTLTATVTPDELSGTPTGWVYFKDDKDPAWDAWNYLSPRNATDVEVGGVFGCAVIATTGGVKCWGANGSGQLGDGTTTDRGSPVDVVGLPKDAFGNTKHATTVAVGSTHACALFDDGSVACWGSNGFGQLGDGGTIVANAKSTVPVVVGGLGGDIQAISAGADFTCALRTVGTVACWGNNAKGQLGRGPGGPSASSSPGTVSGVTESYALDTGWYHACALRGDSATLKCWGSDTGGTPNPTPQTIAFDGGISISALSLAGSHSCVITGDAIVRCWGGNSSGQLGDGTTTDRPAPVAGPDIGSVWMITTGDFHTCAYTYDQKLYCWGRDDYGATGIGDAGPNGSIEIATDPIVELTGGARSTCVRTTSSWVRCWGSNTWGQLGRGSISDTVHPEAAAVPGLAPRAVAETTRSWSNSEAAANPLRKLSALFQEDSNGGTLLGDATSPAIDQTLESDLVATTTTLYSTGNPAAYGTEVDYTVSVSAAEGSEVPTGTVELFIDGDSYGDPQPLASGVTSFDNIPVFSVGSHEVKAVYTPDEGFVGSEDLITQVVMTPVTISVASSPNPSEGDEEVTLTATVTADNGTMAPTGTVLFIVDGSVVNAGDALQPGAGATATASFTTSALGVGSHQIQAYYSGASYFYDALSGEISHTVGAEVVDTSLTITADENPSDPGTPVTFTVTATPETGSDDPAGVVTLIVPGEDSNPTAPLVDGTATFAGIQPPAGTSTIRATLKAEAPFGDSEAEVEHTVLRVVDVALQAAPNPVGTGEEVTFTVSIAPAENAGLPKGTVSLRENGDEIGSVPLPATGNLPLVVTFKTSALAQGDHPVQAVYSGDDVYAGTTSGVVDLSVRAATTTTLTTSKDPSRANETVTFTATVTSAGGTPTGTVEFVDDEDAVIGAAELDGTGTAVFATADLDKGEHPIRAVYPALTDDRFAPSKSAIVAQTVEGIATATTVASTPNPSLPGQTVTLTALVDPTADGGAAPTGNVTFRRGATELAEVPLLPKGVVAVAAGGRHSCAIDAEGAVWCWGDNEEGELGDGTTTPRAAPAKIKTEGTTLGKVAAIGAGFQFTCALSDAAEVWCWGSNSAGRLGTNNGQPQRSLTPVKVTGIPEVATLSVGESSVCTTTTAGEIWCWGANSYGHLGNGNSDPQPAPVKAVLPSGAGPMKTVSTTKDHTCALSEDGGVWCWGANLRGQLGHGVKSFSAGPTKVDTSSVGAIRQIVTGDQFTCALSEAGKVWCWGDDDTTWLPSDGVALPVLIDDSALDGALALSANSFATCAITAEDEAVCWGDNQNGELGDGTFEFRSSPTAVAGLSEGVTFLSRGRWHTCAITTAEGLACWGYNEQAQLGVTGIDRRPTPAPVPGLPAKSVASFDTTFVAGSHDVYADYEGDGVFNASSGSTAQTVIATPTLMLTSSKNPSTFGESVSFSVTASGPSGLPLPTGSVSFKAGQTVLATVALSGAGKASIATAALAAGSHAISVAYAGNGTYGAGTSGTVTQTVNPAATTTTVTSSSDPVVIGKALDFTVKVASPAGTPGGSVTVTVKKGATTVKTFGPLALSGGSATTPDWSFDAAGAYTVTASYAGAGNHAGSSGTLTQDVLRIATATALTASPNPSLPGAMVTFTATVTPAPDAGGIVAFFDGTTKLGESLTGADGKATLKTDKLASSDKPHPIKAQYAGSAVHEGSTSPVVNHVVRKLEAVARITTDPKIHTTPMGPGVTVTISATVSAKVAGGPTPTGQVTFRDGSTVLRTVALSRGKASATITGIQTGTHALSVSYAGNGTYGATSAAVTAVVDAALSVGKRVNSVQASTQDNPAIAMLSGGRHVVIWESLSQDGSLEGIYGRALTSGGLLSGKETRINTRARRDQASPDLVATSDTGIYTAWDSDQQDGSGLGIYRQRLTVSSAGIALAGTESRLNSLTNGSQADPSVAALAKGGTVAVWQSGSGDDTRVMLRRARASGTALGADERVDPDTGAATAPAVAALTGGGFVVVWRREGSDGRTDVMAQLYGPTYVKSGKPFVVEEAAGAKVTDPAVAALGTGGFVIAWAADPEGSVGPDVYGRVFDGAGKPLTGEVRLNETTAGVQSAPALAPLGNGSFVAVWVSADKDGKEPDVFLKRFDGRARGVDAELMVNGTRTGDQRHPDVASDGDRRFSVVWSGPDRSGAGVYLRRYLIGAPPPAASGRTSLAGR